MIRKKVKSFKPYEVIITDGFKDLDKELKKVVKGKKICLISDDTVYNLYGKEVESLLGGYEVRNFIIKHGEKSKNLDEFKRACEFLASKNFLRQDTVLALGGGVVGDFAGFVASSYMRGITFVNLPTTLLADIDSSIGGKTAVDLPQGKNLVGTFYPPALCFINTVCLKTLPKTEIDCGLGEGVKCAFLSKKVKADKFELFNPNEFISSCIDVKIKCVQKDEREKGLRKLLNLGHTVGHAIESLSEYSIPHGVCVAKGIDACIDVSCAYYRFSAEKKAEMKRLLYSFGFDLTTPYKKTEIIEKIKLDKKASDEYIDFVLLKDIGKPKIEKIKIKDLEILL